MISGYLYDIIYLLIAAVIAVPIFKAINMGAVPGFLIAGIAIGPSGLSLVNNITEIGHLAEIGVVLLLFIIGVELKPTRLWNMRRMVFGLGSLQIIVTGAIISIFVHYVLGVNLAASVLIGPALALSSTAFVLQLLNEQHALGTEYGHTSFAILLMQDLAVVPLLALVSLLAVKELHIGADILLALLEALFILGLVILGGRYFLHPILHRLALADTPEVFTSSAVLLVLGTGIIMEHVGLSMAMGAFLAGLLISDSVYRHQVIAEIEPLRGLLLGIFFMSMGMSLNLEQFLQQPLLALGITAVLMISKTLVLWPLAYFFGCRTKSSLSIALMLSQSGEFALVLFAMGLELTVIDNTLYQQLLLAVLLSMLATPMFARLAQYLIEKQKTTFGDLDENMPDSSPIVLAGFGRVGHRVGEILSNIDQPFVALDKDASRVEKERTKGHPVYYGDVRKPEVLRSLGAGGARLVIVTLNDLEATEQVVSALRQAYPEMTILARGHDQEQCHDLRMMGASMAISENLEASVELSRQALVEIGINEETRDSILADFKTTYYDEVNDILGENKVTSE